MKTIIEPEFKAVPYMRERRQVLSEKLSKMSKTEILDFFQKQGKKASNLPLA